MVLPSKGATLALLLGLLAAPAARASIPGAASVERDVAWSADGAGDFLRGGTGGEAAAEDGNDAAGHRRLQVAPAGPPVWTEGFPSSGDLLSGNTIALSATVLDDDIDVVRFNVRRPDGTTSGFQRGVLTSSAGDLTTWTFDVDASGQAGQWGYRIKMRDGSGNAVLWPENLFARRLGGGKHGGGGGGGGAEWIEFTVTDGAVTPSPTPPTTAAPPINPPTPSPTGLVTPSPTGPVVEPGPPLDVDSSPSPNDILSGDSVQLSATVLDDDIDVVRFNVRRPDGTRAGFAPGTQISAEGDVSTWIFDADTSVQKGEYGFRFEMRDLAGNVVVVPGDGSWTPFVVADTIESLVSAARSEITQAIGDFQGGNLAAKFVRLGFHDCVGGCDGCIDLTNVDNFGLLPPMEALQPIVEKYAPFGITRADIWVLAALEGARDSQANGDPDAREFPMSWIGRPNCEELNAPANCVENSCTEERGPHRDLPSPHLDTHQLLDFFRFEFDFHDPRETVAIMGAHTIGTLARENSGFNGPNGWLGNTNRFDNGYYNNLIGGTLADFQNSNFEAMMNSANWQQVKIENADVAAPDRWEWERNTNPHFVMINSDIALVRDLSDDGSGASLIDDDEGQVSRCQFRCNQNGGAGCGLPRCPHAAPTFDIAAEYKHDNAKFLEDFEAAFLKVLENGFDSSAGCVSPPCTVPA